MSKCEFCDMTLQSHLDVFKHIASQVHRENVKKHRDIQPLNKSYLRDTPSNIIKVFESLKLRTISDVQNLADKTYFRIRNQDKEKSAALLGVADELVNVLLESVVDYRTRFCNPENRKKIKNSLCRVKAEPKEQIRAPGGKERATTTQTANFNPVAPQPRPANQSDGGQSDRTRTSPPLKRRPPPVIQSTNPVGLSIPVGSQVSSQEPSGATGNLGTAPRLRPQNATGGNDLRSDATNHPQPRSAGLKPGTKPVAPKGSINTTTQNRSSSRPVTPSTRISEAQATRQATQHVRNPRPSGPRFTQDPRPSAAPVTQVSRPTAPRATQAPRPVAAPVTQVPRPTAPRITPSARPVAAQNIRPAGPRVTQNLRPAAPQITRGPRPTGPQINRAMRPPSDIPPPEQMPMAGASFMPYNPLRNEPPPQPRLDSDYRPRLAIIKVEPKDK